jgi:DNA-directed RNA polymerase subunit RPC12/RpoP
MSLLTQCRCPRCSGHLPIAKVWWAGWPGGGLWPLFRTTGVVCPTCGLRLVILASAMVCANVVISALSVGLGVWVLISLLDALRPQQVSVPLLIGLLSIFAAVVVYVHYRISPLFANVRVARDDEDVYYPLGEPAATSNNRWRGP